jgi:hypothetical protein
MVIYKSNFFSFVETAKSGKVEKGEESWHY